MRLALSGDSGDIYTIPCASRMHVGHSKLCSRLSSVIEENELAENVTREAALGPSSAAVVSAPSVRQWVVSMDHAFAVADNVGVQGPRCEGKGEPITRRTDGSDENRTDDSDEATPSSSGRRSEDPGPPGPPRGPGPVAEGVQDPVMVVGINKTTGNQSRSTVSALCARDFQIHYYHKDYMCHSWSHGLFRRSE